jgi:hypothetical protein
MSKKRPAIPKWLPRNGKRLMEERKRSRLEGYVAARLTQARKVVRYPLVAVVIGAIITTTIHRYLMARSMGLLLIAVWLAIDIWEWLLRKERRHHQWRFVIGCTSTSVLFIAVMSITWWMLSGVLADDRTEVLDKLAIEYSIPENDPTRSIISVTNGSRYDISSRHRIACRVNYAVGFNGTSVIYGDTGAGMGLIHKPDGRWTVFNGPWNMIPIEDTGIVIHAGGDTASESCIAALDYPAQQIDCFDVTINFQYFLAEQPDIEQEKPLRLVTHTDGHGGFKWYKESLDKPHNNSYCATFYKRPK